MCDSPYVIITPARNEAGFIERTLEGVVAQTLRPLKWIIVSDGSTDRTDAIVRRYEERHGFIETLRLDDGGERDFASKVYAFHAGLAQLDGTPYEFIGNLDADISMEPGYYADLLKRFHENPRLGLAGGMRLDLFKGRFVEFKKSANSVGGCVQLYRRRCFEDTGGYLPMRFGGEDAVAEITARMRGWEVRSFSDLKVFHHRETGTAGAGVLKARCTEGVKDYLIGYHPLFEIFRCAYRVKQKRPILLGGALILAGYLWAMLRRYERPVPDEVVKYLRAEQMARLFSRRPMLGLACPGRPRTP